MGHISCVSLTYNLGEFRAKGGKVYKILWLGKTLIKDCKDQREAIKMVNFLCGVEPYKLTRG